MDLSQHTERHRAILQSIARQAMLERGFLPDFSEKALAELDGLHAPVRDPGDESLLDLRGLLWSSIDNDDSRDLDQLTVAEALPGDLTKILVAIADVDSLVKKDSAIDEHALHNTTSVYTAAEIFPMLPEKLSTDLTSLNENEDRLAIVAEMVIDLDGTLHSSAVYQAQVRNHAQLTYHHVGSWLENGGEPHESISAIDGLVENLHLQDQVAQSMRNFRYRSGALNLETIEAKPVFDGDQVRDLEKEEKNRAKEIIEDFMIAANGVIARYFGKKNLPLIRRVVRTPKRWERIVELAHNHGYRLPAEPDSKALDGFLLMEKTSDPLRFPDLSLSVIKLLGSGEYVAEKAGDPALGHFGLAVKDYAHSTAPNRRYPDLVTQRMLKAALVGLPAPYSYDEMDSLAQHFTQQEDAANKVERQVGKSAAALLLQSRIGQEFDALVTGASEKGTWARLIDMPVEGRVEQGFEGLDVGDKVRVELISVSIERGFIDFKRVGSLSNGGWYSKNKEKMQAKKQESP